MTKTREQLVRRALHKLGVIGAGQSPAAEDASLVDDSVGPVMSDLATRDIWVWGDPDQIPDEAFEHAADVLAVAVSQDFGKPPDEQRRLMAESRLRQLNLTTLSGQPQVAEYF